MIKGSTISLFGYPPPQNINHRYFTIDGCPDHVHRIEVFWYNISIDSIDCCDDKDCPVYGLEE